MVTILSICALTAFAIPKTALFATHAETVSQQVIATNSPATFADTSDTKLLSPTTYEQYLSLSSPTDVDVCENFTAIADGNILYVYDRIDGIYRKYTHGENTAQNKITKIQFDDEERLYFLDASTALYVLDPMRLDETGYKATKTELVCSTFAIFGNQLFYANTSGNKSQISGTPLNKLTFSDSTTYVENLTLNPVLAFYKDELYYTNSGQYLNKIATSASGKSTLVSAFDKELLSLSLTNGKVYCVTIDGEFLVYDLNALADAKQASEITPIEKKTGGYSSITIHGEHSYLLKNKSVVEYSLQSGKFTDYEITNTSSAAHRLNNATDITLANDKLFLSDVGNKRISIYDIQENKFLKSISANLAASYIAADENSVLIANQSEAILFDLTEENYGKQLSVSPRLDGNLVGVVNVYGKYYMVTDKNRFYTLSKNTTSTEWEWKTAQKNFTQFPTALTADVYGNLYVACEKNVFAYNESNFATVNVSTEAVLTNLPENTTKLNADYRGNLYALANNTLYKFTAPKTANGKFTAAGNYALNDALFFNSASAVQSFALSLDSNATYVLHKDNFLTVTKKVQLPTVNNISVNDADKSIFDQDETTFTVVQTKPNALLVAFDINALRDSTVFPTTSYARREEPITALKIGELNIYNLIAVYNEKAEKYETYLVLSNSCEEYETDGYKTIYTEAEQREGFAINTASLYKIPYAIELFSTQSVPRDGQVTLLGEITKLDRPYYYVSYVDENGETKTGYVPKVYISPLQRETESIQITVGGTKNNVDAYGRLTYLLLGTAVICILVDYLLLRKPKEEDYEDETQENTDNEN